MSSIRHGHMADSSVLKAKQSSGDQMCPSVA
jgi:hypothetical protein